MCQNSTEENKRRYKSMKNKANKEENDWDRNVEGDEVEGPAVCVSREEVLQALNQEKPLDLQKYH